MNLFRNKKRDFPSCNGVCCATQHNFLRDKKIFHIVKSAQRQKKTGDEAPVFWDWLFAQAGREPRLVSRSG
jgi:hypothetical protein